MSKRLVVYIIVTIFISYEVGMWKEMVVVAHGHGGDCGGDPPHGGNWQPPSGSCSGDRNQKKVCGEARNVELRRVLKRAGNKPLKIEFDDDTLNSTWMPMGNMSIIGTCEGMIHYTYPKWEDVRASDKLPILPTIETYFDMRPLIKG